MIALRSALLAALVLALPATDALAQRRKPPAGAGEMLSQSCFACHGPRGSSVAGPIPIIGGQKEAYLVAALRAFRDGSRPSSIMGRLMKGYTENEITAIAAYLAKLEYSGAVQQLDPAKVAAGREAYGRACKRCHVDGGRDSAEAEYPIVGGQWLDYLQMTMAEILAGKHTIDDKFRAALDKLKPDEVDAVLHFYAAQRGGPAK